MPVVTVDPQNYEKFELSSAPPDGYVMLRPLPYGMKLSRRSKATKMMMRSQPTQSRGKAAQPQESVFEVESMDEWAVAFDFAYCIGEHNLQSADGQLIDFSKNAAMKIKMLDPRVGTEIERLIDALNNNDDEESLEDFLKRQDTSSTEKTNLSETVGEENSTEASLHSV